MITHSNQSPTTMESNFLNESSQLNESWVDWSGGGDNENETSSILLTSGTRHGLLPFKYELDMSIQIGLYSTIFLLAVLGNSLVILTLVQNQGMRTITNTYLLNLSVADLLVGLFCIPPTLVGIILKDFVFGSFLCKLIPYLQAVSVAVSAWTLVAISVERYYAICHPLTSRRWQTLSHAYRIIVIVWVSSVTCMLPIAFVSVLQPIRKTGRHKCREEWPSAELEKTYTVFLDIILLVLPLVIMMIKYGLITRTLWPASTAQGTQGLNEHSSMLTMGSGTEESPTPSASPRFPPGTALSNMNTASSGNGFRFSASFRLPQGKRGAERDAGEEQQKEGRTYSFSLRRKRKPPSPLTIKVTVPTPTSQEDSSLGTPITPSPSNKALQRQVSHPTHSSFSVQTSGILRRCNQAKSLKRKKRVIQMLGLIVSLFFICWTPLYVMNTWYLFRPAEVYEAIGHVGVSLIQLLAYISCCCNPITLCVMSKGFRISFCSVFGCHCDPSGGANSQSQINRNDSVMLSRNRSLYVASLPKTTEQV